MNKPQFINNFEPHGSISDPEATNEFVEEQYWDGFMNTNHDALWCWGTPEAIDNDIWHACRDDWCDTYPLGTMFCPRCNVRLVQEYIEF